MPCAMEPSALTRVYKRRVQSVHENASRALLSHIFFLLNQLKIKNHYTCFRLFYTMTNNNVVVINTQWLSQRVYQILDCKTPHQSKFRQLALIVQRVSNIQRALSHPLWCYRIPMELTYQKVLTSNDYEQLVIPELMVIIL